jgi:hypothetical protein
VEAPGRVWLSTSDGIRLLNQSEGNRWQVTAFKIYYQGQPAFVSGGYIPGVDAERLWGYVETIYVPPQKRGYAPFVISAEHGLFTWGGYHGVWHHFLPHYWGANSPWLDTRDLIRHRRPTCIAEDGAGNLWIGTDGDGLLRLNAHARDYFRRGPDTNNKDGTEFTFFGAKELGCDFDVVVALNPSRDPRAIWALVKAREWTLAHFDGERWGALRLDEEAWCIAETQSGVACLGTSRGVIKVDWPAQTMELLQGPREAVLQITAGPSNTIYCASRSRLYEMAPAP